MFPLILWQYSQLPTTRHTHAHKTEKKKRQTIKDLKGKTYILEVKEDKYLETCVIYRFINEQMHKTHLETAAE